MITPLRVSKYKYNFAHCINEDAVQSAVLPADNSQANQNQQQNNEQNTDPQSSQPNQNSNEPQFTAQDVDGMDENEVLNYVYFDIPQNIDDATRQKLYARADQIRQNRQNGTITGQSATELANGIIRDAKNFLANKKF